MPLTNSSHRDNGGQLKREIPGKGDRVEGRQPQKRYISCAAVVTHRTASTVTLAGSMQVSHSLQCMMDHSLLHVANLTMYRKEWVSCTKLRLCTEDYALKTMH